MAKRKRTRKIKDICGDCLKELERVETLKGETDKVICPFCNKVKFDRKDWIDGSG